MWPITAVSLLNIIPISLLNHPFPSFLDPNYEESLEEPPPRGKSRQGLSGQDFQDEDVLLDWTV